MFSSVVRLIHAFFTPPGAERILNALSVVLGD
jgi:hypothetical protein